MSSLLSNKINKVDRYIIDEFIKEEKGSLYEEIKIEWCFHWFQTIKDNLDENEDEIENYMRLSSNPNISWEIVQANQDKDWSYYNLSRHPNITWDIVYANPDKPWAYDELSCNPNINWKIMEKWSDREWDYNEASSNPMTKSKLDFIKKKFELFIKIKYELMEVVLHPNNKGKLWDF